MEGPYPTFQTSEVGDQRPQWGSFVLMSKRFQMVAFKGPSQEKSPSEIFRFGY
jgi:hypothetical protein